MIPPANVDPTSVVSRKDATSARVNEIDGLRFLAAFLVVVYHFTFRGYAADDMSVLPYPLLAPFSKYGYLGVELFFIISGFVILMTAANGSLQRFLVSRIVRLYPAFWASCTITFLLTLAIGGSRYSASMSQYLINMTMLSGAVNVDAIDGVYWSLFVELRFYALVAVVLAIGRIHQAQPLLILWLAASIVLEFFPVPALRYLLLGQYSAYFIAGAACFLIWSRGMSWTRGGLIVSSWGLALFQEMKALPEFETHYGTDMSGYALGAIITGFFLVMLLVALRWTGFLGRQRWMVAGVLTYPLYLLHHNIGFMVFNLGYPAVNAHLLVWGTLLAVLVSAYAVHVLVEKRFSLPMKNALNALSDAAQRLNGRRVAASERRGSALGT